ncbi:GGDEF domain-containing protein [Hydrocarboniclastica marina]|uniref:diguanylate cyclase n=1 Tax=Hydrocarboniclastica marina TaxID=2259620 RepID=A0A4P7XHB9_9ALTE|nr:sensor domain-containing diguanylate cyclase [Hydrocarboniclastica marina]MAM00563.1 GGDEF domain-containing protein [Alteromonadaceae bacterium]QCF26429.1 sensor domain-containing diguanylate cyclase [Hydrocarboniclastica marina]
MSEDKLYPLNVSELIEHARNNERIARTLFEIEVEVMNLSDCAAFFDRLTDMVRERFALDDVWLVLSNIEANARLAETLREQGALNTILTVATVDLLRLVENRREPVLVDELARYRQLIPPTSRDRLGSLAILPLVMDDRIVGAMILGTRDRERYQPGMEFFFLHQLAVKVSIGFSSVWAREQLRLLATRDALTGLRNRRDLDLALPQELSRARRYGQPLSLLFMDCDDFKQINDTHGHDCGDAYLRFLARIFISLLREDDSVFRYAGDEFVVVLPNQTYSAAQAIAERMEAHLQQVPFSWRQKALVASISYGIASTSQANWLNAEDMLRHADQKLYALKRERKAAL